MEIVLFYWKPHLAFEQYEKTTQLSILTSKKDAYFFVVFFCRSSIGAWWEINIFPVIKSEFGDIVVLILFRIFIGFILCNSYCEILPYEVEKKENVNCLCHHFLCVCMHVCVWLWCLQFCLSKWFFDN